MKAATSASKPVRQRELAATKEAGPVQRLLGAQQSLQQSRVSIPNLLLTSLAVGLSFGTAFQVTHNNGLLPVCPSMFPCQLMKADQSAEYAELAGQSMSGLNGLTVER